MEKYFIRAIGFIVLLTNVSFAQISHQIDLNELILTTSNITGEDGDNYTKITMGNLHSSLKVSEPELPVKHVKLIIPKDQKPVSFQVNLGNPVGAE